MIKIGLRVSSHALASQFHGSSSVKQRVRSNKSTFVRDLTEAPEWGFMHLAAGSSSRHYSVPKHRQVQEQARVVVSDNGWRGFVSETVPCRYVAEGGLKS